MLARHYHIFNAYVYVKAPIEENLDLYLHWSQGMKIENRNLDESGATITDEAVLRLQMGLFHLKHAGSL